MMTFLTTYSAISLSCRVVYEECRNAHCIYYRHNVFLTMKLYSNIFTLKMSLTIDTFQYLIALLRCKYTVVHKSCATYFLNRSMKHWPILIIFGR